MEQETATTTKYHSNLQWQRRPPPQAPKFLFCLLAFSDESATTMMATIATLAILASHNGNHDDGHLGFHMGNPGVFRSNPYPNPSLPVPRLWGTGLSINRLWVSIVYINLVLYYII